MRIINLIYSPMIFPRELSTIITMWLAPKAYIFNSRPKGKLKMLNQVMVPFTGSHVLALIGGTLMATLIGGYIAQNWLKNKWPSAS